MSWSPLRAHACIELSMGYLLVIFGRNVQINCRKSRVWWRAQDENKEEFLQVMEGQAQEDSLPKAVIEKYEQEEALNAGAGDMSWVEEGAAGEPPVDEDVIKIPNVRPNAYLGPYERSDLAEIAMQIVKEKRHNLLKEWVRLVSRADKSEGHPIARVTDFGLNTPLHVACGPEGSITAASILLDNKADWRLENEFGLNPVHVACASGNLGMIEYLLSRGDVDFKVPSGVFKCKGYNGDGSRCSETIVEYGFCQENPAHVKMAVEERRRQRALAVKKGLPDVTDEVDIDADNEKAQAVKDLVARSPTEIAQIRGHGPVVRLIDAYLEGNALAFEKSFRAFLAAETDVETEETLEHLRVICAQGWKSQGRALTNLRAYLYLALLIGMPKHWTHGVLERTLNKDGYLAMENRFKTLIEALYIKKRSHYVLKKWAHSTELKLQETLAVVSDIYQIHPLVTADYDEFGEDLLPSSTAGENIGTKQSIDPMAPSENYMCDRYGFIIYPIETTVRPFFNQEILNCGSPDDDDLLPSNVSTSK